MAALPELSFARKLSGAAITTLDLMVARVALGRITPGDVLARNHAVQAKMDGAGPAPDEATIALHCNRVAFLVSRMARRVPWRSDCLVQALAGQRALKRAGIASQIVVGTARGADGAFEAHAWLVEQDRIVLGGDIGRFAPVLADPQGQEQPGAGPCPISSERAQ